MLLGIILFYIKSVFVILQSPGIGAGSWRDLPPNWFSQSSCPGALRAQAMKPRLQSEQEPPPLAGSFIP